MHDRDSEPLRIEPRPRERWTHPFASITEDPLRDPPALIERLRPSDNTADPLLVARIEAVHRTLSRCGVPHVLPLRGVERTDDGGLLVVHREVLGEDLGTMLSRGPLGLERAITILRQLCRSIGRAHAVGIEHRLLGPASVILTGRGTGPGVIEIIDFGLSNVVSDEEVDGDAAVLAPITPESVLGGESAVSEDVYAIGALAFWMIAGRPPFRGDDAATLRRRHAIEDCPSIADVAPYDLPDTLVDAIDRALHKDPDDRPADIAELEAAIIRAQRQARIETPYDALLDGPPRSTKREKEEPGQPPGPRRRRTAPMSIDPALVDGGSGTRGVAARGTSHPPKSRRGGTLVEFVQAPTRSRRRRAIVSALLSAGLLGAWLLIASSGTGIDDAHADPQPDAPSVYAEHAPKVTAPAAAVVPRSDEVPLPTAPGAAAAVEPEPEWLADAPIDDDEELADIVIEDADEGEPARTEEPRSSATRLSDAQCTAERRTAFEARNEHRWRALLSATRHGECWASHRERAKLRVKALMELQRFEGCARVGAALSRPDPELQRWVALCRERAHAADKSAAGPKAEPNAEKDRYAAASTQQ